MPRNFTDKSFWNVATTKVNATSVPVAGEINSLFQNLGLPCPPQYGSQDDVGKRVCLAEIDMYPIASSQYQLSTGQQLYGGIYELVYVDTAATAANIGPGKAAFLLDTVAGGGTDSGALVHCVTDESHAASFNQLCGVFLFAAAVGTYTFIQVHGKAVVQYRAAVTNAAVTGAIMLQGAGTGVFDSIAAATAIVGGTAGAAIGSYIGQAISVPANGAVGTIQMRPMFGRY